MNQTNKHRIAIVDLDLCKPKKCNKECKSICPVERIGKECIEIDIESVAKISETSCLGCSACSKVCIFGAVTIINLPKELSQSLITHRYSDNGFRLYKLPQLRQGNIMGIIGQNGIGKTSVISILGNKIKPNFEINSEVLSDKEIIKQFRGTEIQKYLTKLYDGKLTISIKPQNIDTKLRILKMKNSSLTVKELLIQELKEIDSSTAKGIELLELQCILDSRVATLSGGELQRVLCLVSAMRRADVYIFDEPTNFLDVKQRLRVAQLINELNSQDTFVILIEHDLAILDYISDSLTIMFGNPGIYGVCSLPYGTSEGVNSYFSGYIRAENMRFRDFEYDFRIADISDFELLYNSHTIPYESFSINHDNFKLNALEGNFPMESSITVLLGENGSGKTTFLNHLKDYLGFSVSYKTQYLDITKYKKLNGSYPTVEELFFDTIRDKYIEEQFKSDIIRPMAIEKIKTRQIDELSGGELQKVFIILCLGRDAHIYLIDEPSANLDIEQRINITKMIKRFILHNRKVCFVVEHDMMISVSLAQELTSRVIVFEQTTEQSIEQSNVTNVRTFVATQPLESKIGINKFLKIMGVTFRTDSHNSKCDRPRINKLNSGKDIEQKKSGQYYQ